MKMEINCNQQKKKIEDNIELLKKLLDFIKKNKILSSKLYEIRNYKLKLIYSKYFCKKV